MKYDRQTLNNKSVRGTNSLRELAMEICRVRGNKSSWVQTTGKADLIEWILINQNVDGDDGRVKTEELGSEGEGGAKVKGIDGDDDGGADGNGNDGDGGGGESADGDNGSDGDGDSDSDADGNSDNNDGDDGSADVPPMVELPEDSETQFVTNSGLMHIEEVHNALGINSVADAVNTLNSASVGTFNTLNKEIGKLKTAVKNASGASGAVEMNITINGAEITKIKEHTHPKFKHVLTDLTLFNKALMIGEAGTGKTFMGGQLAKALGVQFKHISCSEGMAEAHVSGRMLFDGSYVQADFVDCYENGGLFLMDEMDACDANVLVSLNSALANGFASVPNRKDNPTAKQHENFYFLGAMNTYGTDNGSFKYVGRNKMDSATLDRFVCSRHEVGYDTKLEKSFCMSSYNYNDSKVELAEHGGDAIFKILTAVRKRVQAHKMDKVISTRLFRDACIKYVALGGGDRMLKDILNQICIGWSKQDVNRLEISDLLGEFSSELVKIGA